MGFELKKASFFYKFNLFVNFIDLIWMYSLSKGKISFPKIWTAKKASIRGEHLVMQKNIIYQIHKQLNDKTSLLTN